MMGSHVIGVLIVIVIVVVGLLGLFVGVRIVSNDIKRIEKEIDDLKKK